MSVQPNPSATDAPSGIRDGNHGELRKAAILISSLPLDEANHLLRSLAPKQLEQLADAIAKLAEIHPKEQRIVARDLVGTPAPARSQSNRASQSGFHSPALDRYRHEIEHAAPPILAAVLREELPQLIAVVLSEIRPASAAAVLRQLSTDRQLSVVKRMAVLSETHLGNSSTVEALLAAVSSSVQARSQPLRQTRGGEAFLAHVINCTDRPTEKALLENLAEEDRGLVDRLLQRMHLLQDSRRPCSIEPDPEKRAG